MNNKIENPPWFAFSTLLVFVVSLLILILTDRADGELFVVFVISTLPSVVASVFSERASKDIRNHVVQEKARQGAQEALEAIDLPVTPEETGDVVRDVLNEPTDSEGQRETPPSS